MTLPPPTTGSALVEALEADPPTAPGRVGVAAGQRKLAGMTRSFVAVLVALVVGRAGLWALPESAVPVWAEMVATAMIVVGGVAGLFFGGNSLEWLSKRGKG